MKTATESKKETKVSQNKKLLNELARSIKNVDASEQPNRIVKNIDKIIQDYYMKFYDIVDIRKQTTQQKNGHCC
jgi:DNA-binding transcriptional regulator GbsR (MarR family)